MPPSGGSSTSPPAWITRNRLHYTSYARNVFKRTSQSRTSYLLFACLFYVVLLSTCSVSCTNAQSTSLSFRENIDCTYASSTCTTCANVCVHRQFHPLFPSRCHPSFSDLTYSTESHPDRTSPSVRFYGNNSFSVPQDLLAPLTGRDNYTIVLYFKEETNGTLFQLNKDLKFRYSSMLQQIELLTSSMSKSEFELLDTINADGLGGIWKSLYVTFDSVGSSQINVTTYFANQKHQTALSFSIVVSDITIGEEFNGFIQDVRVYTPSLQPTASSQIVLPMEASFLPQCLCPSGYSLSQDEAQCTMMAEQEPVPLSRYNTNAHPAEFSADSSTTTSWQSEDGISLATLVVGLEPSIILSKIFVRFSSALPSSVRLQYYSEMDSVWRDLQSFSEDCKGLLGETADQPFTDPYLVICLPYSSSTSLTFLLAGTKNNPRPQPDASQTSLEDYFRASSVRLMMDDLTSSAVNFAIEDIEICPDFCFNLDASCTCDMGSGMFMTDILEPTSTSASSPSSSSMSVSSSLVDTGPVNSNTFVSTAISMSPSSIASVPTTTELPLTSTTVISQTMTFMSSQATEVEPSVGVVSTVPPTTLAVPFTTSQATTSVVAGTSSSSVAEALSSGFVNPTSTAVMTSAIFEQPTTVAATSSAIGVFTSEAVTGVPSSLMLLSPTPAPSTSSMSEEVGMTSSSDQLITTSSRQSEQLPVSTTPAVQESSVAGMVPTTSVAAPVSTTQEVNEQFSTPIGVTTSTQEGTTVTTTLPTATTFSAPFTSLLMSPVQSTSSAVELPLATTSMAAASVTTDTSEELTLSSSMASLASLSPTISMPMQVSLSSSSNFERASTSMAIEPSVTMSSIAISSSPTTSSSAEAVLTSLPVSTPQPSTSDLAVEPTESSSIVDATQTRTALESATPLSSVESSVVVDFPSTMPSRQTSFTSFPSTLSSMSQMSAAQTQTTSFVMPILSETPAPSSSASQSSVESSASTMAIEVVPSPTTSAVSPSQTSVETVPTTLDTMNQTSFEDVSVDMTQSPTLSQTLFTPTAETESVFSTQLAATSASDIIEFTTTPFTTPSVFPSSMATSASMFDFNGTDLSPTPLPTIPAFTTVVQTSFPPSLSSMSIVLPTESESTFLPSFTVIPSPSSVLGPSTPIELPLGSSSSEEISPTVVSPSIMSLSATETETSSLTPSFTGAVMSSSEVQSSMATSVATAISVTGAVSSSTPFVSMTPEATTVEGSDFFGSGDSTMLLFPESTEVEAISSTTSAAITQTVVPPLSPSASFPLATTESANATDFITSTPTQFVSFSFPTMTTGLAQPSDIFTLTPSESIPQTSAPSLPVTPPASSMTPVFSSVMPTPIFSPSPTPTPTIAPVTSFLPPCQTPSALFRTDTEGLGFVLTEDVSRVESDMYGLTYSVGFGKLIATSYQVNSSGVLTASFGKFSGHSEVYNLTVGSPTMLNGFLSDERVWLDKPSLHVAFQVRDDNFNSNIDANCTVVFTNERENVTNTTDCVISSPCGTSSVKVNIPHLWFAEAEQTSVSIAITIQNSPMTFDLGSVVLMPTGPTEVDDTVFMVPPKHALLPGEEFSVPIYTSLDIRLAAFSLDCEVLGTAAVLKGAVSNYTWSLLSRDRLNSTNRMSLTGFRNYDRTNTGPINFTESLVELIIAVRPESELSGEDRVEIECKAIKLVQTTGDDLVEAEMPFYLRSLNRNGEIAMTGIAHLETRKYAGHFGCTAQNEIVNVAGLTNETNRVDMSIHGFNVRTGNLDELTNGLGCISNDDRIIKVDASCMHVYFDGTETLGSEEIHINMMTSDLQSSGSIPFRIWLPSKLITVILEDRILNAVNTTANCESASILYQQSRVAITTSISTGINNVTAYVTSLLRPYLRSSDENVAQLIENNLYVQGMDIGMANIYVSTLDEAYGVEITVSYYTVEAKCVDIFTFSGISVSEVGEFSSTAIVLEQDFEFIGSKVYIVPVVQFSDEARMILTEEYDDLLVSLSLEVGEDIERSTLTSNTSYEIVGPINDFSVTVLWTFDLPQECGSEVVTFTGNYSFTDAEPAADPSLIISVSSNTVTAPGDAAAYFGVPDFVLVEAHLSYNEMFVSNITDHPDTKFELVEDSQNLAQLTSHLGLTRRVETRGDMSGTVTIRVTFSLLNLTSEYNITIKRKESFVLTAYRDDGTATSELRQIGNSNLYQRATFGAIVSFSDGEVKEISNDSMIVRIISDHSNIVNTYLLQSNILAVSDGGLTTNLEVVVHAVLVDSSFTSDNLTITIDNAPLYVTQITGITLSSTSSTVTEPVYADCSAVLDDGTVLSSTFNNDGTPIYSGLIAFSTINSDIVNIEDGLIALKKNSLESIHLVATATVSNVTDSKNVSVRLNPSPGEIGLKSSANQVAMDDYFVVSVMLNSAEEAVGVYEVELTYGGVAEIEVVDIVQGESWRNGSVISAETSDGAITIGGVLNMGVQDQVAELANVTFKALGDGIVSLNVTTKYITNASVIPVKLETLNFSQSGQIEVEITSSQMSKRDVSFDYVYDYYDDWSEYAEAEAPAAGRYRRASCTTPPTNDINGDCLVNLIDVYILQEFISAEVYDFQTTEGEQLIANGISEATFGDVNITQIFEIERISLDLSFSISGVFYTFFPIDDSNCTLVINGTVVPTNEALDFNDIDSIVQIYLDFSHVNQSFQEEFDNTFGGAAVARKGGVDGLYGGTVPTELFDVGGSVTFGTQVDSSFETEGFTLSVLLSVQINVETNQDTSTGSLGIETVNETIVTGAIDSCMVPVAPSTSIAPSTSPAPPTTSLEQAFTTTQVISSSTPGVPEVTTTAPPPTSTPAPFTTMLIPTATEVAPTTMVEEPTTTTLAPSTSTPAQSTTTPVQPTSTLEALISTSAQPASTPAQLSSTSAQPSSTPAQLSSTPAQLSSSPAQLSSTPAQLSSTPAQLSSTPAQPSSTPAQLSSTSVQPTTILSSPAQPTAEPTTSLAQPSPTLEQPASTSAASIPPPTTDTLTQPTTSLAQSVSTSTAPPASSPIQRPTTLPSSAEVPPASSSMQPTPQPTTGVATNQATTLIEPTITDISSTTVFAGPPSPTQAGPQPTSTIIVVQSTVQPTSTPATQESFTSQGQPSSTPGQAQPSSTPSQAQPSSTPSQAQPSSTPSQGQPSSTPSQAQPSSTPGQAQPSSTPSQAQLSPSESQAITSIVRSTATDTPASSSLSTAKVRPTTMPTTTVTQPTTTQTPPTTIIAITDATTEAITAPPTSSDDATIDDTTTTPSADGGTQAAGSDTVGIIAGIGVVAALLATVVIIFVVVYAVKKVRKKSGIYRPHSNHTTPSRGNKGYFFHEEEAVELNPVNCDLVPLDNINGHFFMETGAESMNIVPNHLIYHGEMNTGEEMIMSGSSMKPLIRDPPEPGRQMPIRGKQSYTNYSESTLDHPPPPYHATGTTITGTTLSSKSGNSTSPYDIEDDYFDLNFNDDPTQTNYLSLGNLTPPSQLSPQDHMCSGSDGSTFFPSMPPPVMPSAFNSGIPMDSPFVISGSSGGGMVMPDAYPGVIVDQPRKSSGGRRSRHDHNPLSQGYPIKLAPVPEQSDPVDDVFSDSYNGRRNKQRMYNGRGGGGWNEEESSSGDSENETSLMFPSADLGASNSQLQRQRGVRKKSGTRRIENGWSQSSEDGMVYSNRGAIDDDVPERDIPPYMADASPRQKGKYLRQQARERELMRQKELLRQKADEDERRRILQQEHRAAMIARDYGSTKYREVDIDQQVEMSQGRVLQEAMKYEAQMQLMQESKGVRGSQSPGTHHSRERMSQEKQLVSPQRQISYGRIVNSFDQFTTI